MSSVEPAPPPAPVVGDLLPELVVDTTPLQLFLFSAASQNAHRIHYDTQWATEVEGYPGLLVQGPLQESLLARCVTDWLDGRGRLVRLRTQNRGSAYAGDRIVFGGAVTDVRHDSGETIIRLELLAKAADGTVLLPGEAEVAIDDVAPAG